MNEVAVDVNGMVLIAKMCRNDRAWGHGVDIKLEAAGHKTLSCSFICHPEFEGYEECQAKSTEQLFFLAQARLREGAAETVMKSGQAGLRVIFRFNGPAESPNN